MTVSPFFRLMLLVLAGIVPRWQLFFTTSTDYSLRGLAMPAIDSLGIACVIIIARTRNPLVDGEPMEVKTAPGQPLQVAAPPGKPVETKEVPPKTTALPVTPEADRVRQ